MARALTRAVPSSPGRLTVSAVPGAIAETYTLAAETPLAADLQLARLGVAS